MYVLYYVSTQRNLSAHQSTFSLEVSTVRNGEGRKVQVLKAGSTALVLKGGKEGKEER
jgi:hypothetical protein